MDEHLVALLSEGSARGKDEDRLLVRDDKRQKGRGEQQR